MTPEQKLEAARANLVDAINGLLCDGFKTARGFCVPLDALIAAAREAGAAERDAAWRARIVEGTRHYHYKANFSSPAVLVRLPLPGEEGDRDE